MLVAMTEPEKRALYFDRGQLHVAMVGSGVIDALLPPSRRGLLLSWCGRGQASRGVTIPVLRESAPPMRPDER